MCLIVKFHHLGIFFRNVFIVCCLILLFYYNLVVNIAKNLGEKTFNDTQYRTGSKAFFFCLRSFLEIVDSFSDISDFEQFYNWNRFSSNSEKTDTGAGITASLHCLNLCII